MEAKARGHAAFGAFGGQYIHNVELYYRKLLQRLSRRSALRIRGRWGTYIPLCPTLGQKPQGPAADRETRRARIARPDWPLRVPSIPRGHPPPHRPSIKCAVATVCRRPRLGLRASLRTSSALFRPPAALLRPRRADRMYVCMYVCIVPLRDEGDKPDELYI